jgi:hypothetical protein
MAPHTRKAIELQEDLFYTNHEPTICVGLPEMDRPLVRCLRGGHKLCPQLMISMLSWGAPKVF